MRVLVPFEVVRELVVLILLLLLQIVRFEAFPLRSWEARQLLLGLRHTDPTSRLNLRILTGSWTSTSEPYLLVLTILVVLDRQLGLAGLNLVALLTHSFSGNVVTLFLLLLFAAVDLQVSGDERRRELVLRNCRGQ